MLWNSRFSASAKLWLHEAPRTTRKSERDLAPKVFVQAAINHYLIQQGGRLGDNHSWVRRTVEFRLHFVARR